MRRILLFVLSAFLLSPGLAGAQDQSAKDLRALFAAAERLGSETELRGDIADRLGFGDQALQIIDLVVMKDGVQHAINALAFDGNRYLLFDSHLYVPEVFIFVKSLDGALIAGIHGRQYEPITSTLDMTPTDVAQVVGAEEAFWFQWLAEGAKMPLPPN